MRRFCVYAGSNPGVRPEYGQAARDLGQALVAHDIGLVYGGGSLGLMGTLASSVIAAGGEAIGVIPGGLFEREVAHPGLTKLYTVASMHERKALMADLSDGFIALPGGFGTLDELFEITTWAQLGLHNKPIGLLNIADYFDPLLALIAHASKEGFISPFHAQLMINKKNVDELLDGLVNYVPRPNQIKWTELPPER